MIWSIAWKNVWRSKIRSLVVIIAVTLGIISGVMLVGIMQGWVEQRMHDAIYNEVSHLQIHNTEYLRNEEILLTVSESSETIKKIESLPGVEGWVKRTKMVAMANTPWANTGLVVYGIDPKKERNVTEIYKKVITGAGEYLNENEKGEILISDKTAEILKLKQYIITQSIIDSLKTINVDEAVILKLETLTDVRYRSPKDFREAITENLTKKELDEYGLLITDMALDYRIRNKIQLTISDEKGTPVQGTFRVCGIYKTTNSGFDQAAVFVNEEDLAELYDGSTILTHEIAILLKNIDDVDIIKEKLKVVSSQNTISSWKDLAPDAAMMNDYMVMYYFIFIGIVMFALAFGIINTMMMTILERTKELGMLMAIGMNRKRIFYMIMLETIFLTIVGAIAGMLAGWGLVEMLGKSGIHFSTWGEGFEAIGFAAVVYPVVTPGFFILITIMVIVTAIISSIWPARKALRLNPVEALRIE